jgi:hypothetical protein
MGHAQCTDVIGRRRHRQLSFRGPRSPPLSTSSSKSIPARVNGLFRIGLSVNRIRIRITELAFQSSSTNGAQSAFHNLCLARCLGAWRNLLATTGDCRGYMRSVQRG